MDMPHTSRTPSIDAQPKHAHKPEPVSKSITEHANKIQTDIDHVPNNPSLKRANPKPPISDKFAEHLLFDNLLFNSERVLQLLEGDQSEIFQDLKDFHAKI